MSRLLAAVTLAALAVPASVSSASGASGSPRHAPHVATTRTLTILHQSRAGGVFSPSTLTIAKGDTVRVHNADNMLHTVTSYGKGSNGKPLFDLSVNGASTSTLSIASSLAPGTYKYYCRIHPSMRGTLVVTGSGGGVGPVPVQFTWGLKVPPVLTGATNAIDMKQAAVQLLPTGPATQMWTYNGTFPGPTIRRLSGYDTKVTYTNDLPSTDGPLSVHLHGDHHSSGNDGQPHSGLIEPGASRTYDYSLKYGHAGRSGFDYYHDHVMGDTGRNNWYGLQGMFLIDSSADTHFGLPYGGYDIPLDVTDRSFDANNQLVDPSTQHLAPPDDHTTGDHILVDGRYAPYLKVNTHRYRLRLLNSSNYSTYDFRLSGGKAFLQIGTGNGLLPKPVARTDISLGPAQRADVVVSFDNDYGKNIMLETGSSSSAATPIMDFQVYKKVTDTSKVPSTLLAPPAITVPKTVSHILDFNLGTDSLGNPAWTIDGETFDPNRIDIQVPYGSTQAWELKNSSNVTHYIHLHEELWHTVLRDGHIPPAWEQGLEDTWRLDPGESVRVAAAFTDYTGVFMVHCHMLDHEDDGMMAQFDVEKAGARVPAGYYLAGSAPDRFAQAHSDVSTMTSMPSMSAGAMSMPMTPIVAHHRVGHVAATPAAAQPGWRRAVSLFGGAMGVEIGVLFAVAVGWVVWRRRTRRTSA